MMSSVTLVLGGARSGKSRWAEQLAAHGGQSVLYVATARAGDQEMADRIAVHRANRPAGWRTLEVADSLIAAIREHAAERSTVLVDCLTLWVSNALLARTALFEDADSVAPSEWRAIESALVAEATDLVEHARSASLKLILVSNEVGLGIVPVYPLGRYYRDILGRVNSAVAQHADSVVLMVAGLPVDLRRLSFALSDATGDE